MQILDTSHIDCWPLGTVLAYSPIREDLHPDILTEKEQREWEGFSNTVRRNEFLTARSLFGFIKEQKGFDPALRLEKDTLGKPCAVNGSSRLYVSFSHSKEYVMCAVSKTRDIGLDIEWTRRKVDARLVKRILNEQEWEVYGEDDPLKLWTMKEAAVKCLGTGLRTNLKELKLKKNAKNRISIKINDDKSFQICSFTALDHQISIAY